MTGLPAANDSARGRFARLPPLKESLARHGLTADKRFGQHFLLDLNICHKIARLAGPMEGQVVIEVGPGPGGLTRSLLEAGAHVVAVERDQRFLPILEELAGLCPGRLTLVGADALAVDEAAILAAHAGGAPARVVSNLPYNIGTALFLKWLLGPWRPSALTLMFQKEVALRITARPGGAAYGRLSVIAQAVCVPRLVMDLPARAFTPPPKVDSAVVSAAFLNPAAEPGLIGALETVTAAAFGQRRKMLRSALRTLGGSDLCLAADIDPDARAETLAVGDFLRLASVWRGDRAQA